MSSNVHAHNLSVLRNVILVSLSETSLWTGRAKLTAEDLGLDEEDVPPEAVASLGSKAVIDKVALRPLNRKRYQLRRACLEVGTKFLSGFAVSADEAEDLVSKLDSLVNEGEALAKQFVATLDTKLDAWHEANPKWKHIFGSGTPERQKIAKKISFGYTCIVVQSPDNPNVAKNLIAEVDMLGSNLIDEIVKEAKLFVKRSLTEGRDAGSQKTTKPIRRLGKKIHALRFVDPSLAPMAEVVNRILKGIPEEGKIEADAFLNLTRVAHLLASRSRFTETSRALHDKSITVDDVIRTLTDQATPLLDVVETITETAAKPLDVSQIFEDGSEDTTAVPTLSQVSDSTVLEAVAHIRGDGTHVPMEVAIPVIAKPVQKMRIVKPLSF